MATGLASNCSACSSASSVLDGAACTDSPPSACIDAPSHVVQLPCHVSAVHTPTVGQRFVLNERDVKGITQMVKDIQWPSNARRVVQGRGERLGATNDAHGARLGRNTTKREALCKEFNSALARALGDVPFVWGSLQVNIDSVSDEHCDSNNTGLSAIVLLGEFTGGRFAMSDQSDGLAADDRGTALIIDGCKPHYSEPFKGFRISVVAFMHKSTMDLPSPQLEYLRSLGFRIPANTAQPDTCPDVSHGNADWPCMTCGAYWSDSGAFRLPGYGGVWDEYGPANLVGSRSARGLTPGPSCMHTMGHPRYEGVLRVQFASHDEWHYDKVCYGREG